MCPPIFWLYCYLLCLRAIELVSDTGKYGWIKVNRIVRGHLGRQAGRQADELLYFHRWFFFFFRLSAANFFYDQIHVTLYLAKIISK